MQKLAPIIWIAIVVITMVVFGCKKGLEKEADLASAYAAGGKTKVFFCAGQSNMVGGMKKSDLIGEYPNAPENAIYWSWAKGSWIDFPDKNSDHDRIGPEISFAHKLVKAFPNDKIAIVKFSAGGMRLSDQWKGGSGDMYKRFIATSKAAIKSLKSSGESYEVAGMIWMQGESDTEDRASGEAYEANLNELIRQVRKELDAPGLPVVVARSSDELLKATQWNFAYTKIVQQGQEKVAQNDANVHLIKIDDIPTLNDHTHFPPAGYFEMGNRFAEAMIKATGGNKEKKGK